MIYIVSTALTALLLHVKGADISTNIHTAKGKQKINRTKRKRQGKKEIVVGAVSPLPLPIEIRNICSRDPGKVRGKIPVCGCMLPKSLSWMLCGCCCCPHGHPKRESAHGGHLVTVSDATWVLLIGTSTPGAPFAPQLSVTHGFYGSRCHISPGSKFHLADPRPRS